MKNKFSPKLFLDGMRQLRTIGLTALLIFCLEGVFVVIGTNNVMMAHSALITDASDLASLMQTFNLCELHPILYATFFILIPVMLLYLFGFLNKRNSSDFYHAAPVRRECLALSFLASIMAWALIVILTSTAVTCIMTLFMQFVSINMYSVLVSLIATTVGCLCVLGAGFFAMSITGTYFTNFAVSVMLLVFPRLIITVYTYLLTDMNPMLSMSFDGGLLDYRYNIVIGSAMGTMIGDPFYPMQNFIPIIYTAVLSVFYFAAGFYAFIRRKSEIATMPAANSKLQLLFRLIPSMMICLIPIAFITFQMQNEHRKSFLFNIILMYVIAVVVYFLYELISTRKVSNLIRSAKTLWILVAFNVIYIGCIVIGNHVILNDIPDKQSVNYIMVETSGKGYFANTSSAVRITNSELIECCVDAFEDTAQYIKDGSRYLGRTTSNIVFNSKGRTMQRRIMFSDSQYEKFMTLLNSNADFTNAYKELPEYKSLTNLTLRTDFFESDFKDEDTHRIYDSLCEEHKNLSFEDAFDNVVNNSTYMNYAVFSGEYINKASNYPYLVPISRRTPKTAILFMNTVNNGSGFNLSDMTEGSNYFIRLKLYDGEIIDNDIYITAGEDYPPGFKGMQPSEFISRAVEELRSCSTDITSLDVPIVKISYQDNNNIMRSRYFAATQEFCDLYEEYMK